MVPRSTETIRTIRDGSPGCPPRLSHGSWAVSSSVQIQCCFTSTKTIKTIRDGEPKTATSTFTQLLNSVFSEVRCCFTFTKTIRLFRDGGPRTPTSSFTQFLNFERCGGVCRHYVAQKPIASFWCPTLSTRCLHARHGFFPYLCLTAIVRLWQGGPTFSAKDRWTCAEMSSCQIETDSHLRVSGSRTDINLSHILTCPYF